MAKAHKAATEVTIASTEEESDLRDFVTRYWPHALVVALAIAGYILFKQSRSESVRAEQIAAWESLEADVDFGGAFGSSLTVPSASIMADVSEELADTSAGPWAKALEVGKRLSENDVDGARAAMGELEQRWPKHASITVPFYARRGDSGPARTLSNHVNDTVAALASWEKAHPGLFENPPLRDGAPRVRITTSVGDIVIGLYDERAPKHAENFLKLCGEGFYDGTKFHRVVENFIVQGGDPNSKTEETPENAWGQGGPGYTVEHEPNGLWHFTDVVASASTSAGGPTSGSQFYFVTGSGEDDESFTNMHGLDGQYSVWGVLLEGKDVVSTIEKAPKLGEKPEAPVSIVSTTIL